MVGGRRRAPRSTDSARAWGDHTTVRRVRAAIVLAVVELQNWDTDEPSERGIDGIERMRLVRDDINTRVEALARQLSAPRS